MRTFPINKNGLTARQILSGVSDEVKARAEKVRVYNLKGRITDYGLEYYARTKTMGKNASGQVYVTSVTLLDPRTRKVFIDCTCPYHPFWGVEYNLNRRNAALILRSNGKAPHIRDPQYRNLSCKHAVALLNLLVEQRRV